MIKLRVGILGATGMVGQRFIHLLSQHPWFDIVALAASPQSAGKEYKDVMKDRWEMETDIPQSIGDLFVYAVEDDMLEISKKVDLVFCALDLDKQHIMKIEESYAQLDIAVISNNSAHRMSDDVPMIIPEVNYSHSQLINVQRHNRKWNKGFIAVKPNCSIQSYVSILTALIKEYVPISINVVSLQSVSGAGKTFTSWPGMVGNIIPYISGEDEKSEIEPLKIWSTFDNGKLNRSSFIKISATCVRVPILYGHMACVSVTFDKKPSKLQILDAIEKFSQPLIEFELPSSPKKFIQYFESDNRPQIDLDVHFGGGMAISMGRLQEDKLFDWKFVALSHNTIRGAAGGAILLAELLVKQGYIQA